MSVIHELEVTELEIFNVCDVWVQSKLREGIRVTLQLLFQRFNVIFVYMSISKHMNELSSLQAAHLSKHASQE